ncbi:MAG: hypothetical protein IT545_15800 [Rhodobacteraceae bacterium]|nr:hypothetical protein [Paracoccaceae bacterium]
MTRTPDPGGPLPPELSLLKWLVVGLAATMAAGLAVVVWLLAVRLPAAIAPAPPALPATIVLPAGEAPFAVTRGRGWLAVVTESDEILVYDATTGALRQRVTIRRGGGEGGQGGK